MGDEKGGDRRRSILDMLFKFDPKDEQEVANATAGFKQLNQFLEGVHEGMTTRTPLAQLKQALVWWTTEREFVDDYARDHWEAILEKETRLRADYFDSHHHFATVDKCRDFAERALHDFGTEIERFLPNEHDRTVDGLTEILRRYHGHQVEELLPAAKRYRRQAAAPAVADSGPLGQLDKQERSTILHGFAGMQTKRAIEDHAAHLYAQYEEKLSQLSLPQEEKERRLRLYLADLQEISRQLLRERGLS